MWSVSCLIPQCSQSFTFSPLTLSSSFQTVPLICRHFAPNDSARQSQLTWVRAGQGLFGLWRIPPRGSGSNITLDNPPQGPAAGDKARSISQSKSHSPGEPGANTMLQHTPDALQPQKHWVSSSGYSRLQSCNSVYIDIILNNEPPLENIKAGLII